MGSSAGGHLASTILTHFDAGNTNATDAIARNGIEDLVLDLAEEGDGYAASIVLGVA